MADWWLGRYGLQLPPSYPFLIGVAGSPEAAEVELQVPSCCVLTTLGLSELPGGYAAALQQLLADLQANAAACGFWGNSLQVETKDCASGSCCMCGGGVVRLALSYKMPCLQHHV
jgi:hypothetical protein